MGVASQPSAVGVLKGFAAQAAVLLDLTDRRLEAEQGAVLADRGRIGRDLRDMVIQQQFATGMRVQGALGLIADDPAEAHSRVDIAAASLSPRGTLDSDLPRTRARASTRTPATRGRASQRGAVRPVRRPFVYLALRTYGSFAASAAM